MSTASRGPLAAVLLLSLAACSRISPDQAAAVVARQLAAAGEAQCRVIKDPDKPLIVEWSGMDAAELEGRLRRGVVAVRYQDCEMEVLKQCRIDGAYAYSESVTRADTIKIRSEDDLYLELPLGAARLGGHLERGAELDLDIVVVGRYDAPEAAHDPAALVGPDCARATHLVGGVTLGAFRLSASETRAGGGGTGDEGRVRLGGQRSRSVEVIKESPPDRLAYCSSVDVPADERRAVCGAPIRLEVVPVRRTDRHVAAAIVPPHADLIPGLIDTMGSVEAHRHYDLALALQRDESAPPEHRTAAWCSLAALAPPNPYVDQADLLCRQWSAYTDALRSAEARLRGDYDALRDLLALAHLPGATRSQAVTTFLGTHAALGDDYPELRAVQRAARRLADGKRASLPDLASPRERRVSRVRPLSQLR